MYSEMSDDEKRITDIISARGKRVFAPDINVLCLNDTGAVRDEKKAAGELISAFEKGFGEKSSFEK